MPKQQFFSADTSAAHHGQSHSSSKSSATASMDISSATNTTINSTTKTTSVCVTKLKGLIVPMVIFASVATVTNNSRNLNLSYVQQLTGGSISSSSSSYYSSNELIRQWHTTLSDTADQLWNVTTTAVSFATMTTSSRWQQTNPQHQQGSSSSSSTITHQGRRALTPHESLVALARPHEHPSCPSNLHAVSMVSNDKADNHDTHNHDNNYRKIPRIVHMTGKTKCLTQPFLVAAQLWQFENHSFYFHDDQAVQTLFQRDWPMFPQLQNTVLCLQQAGGAAIADLWRYLALYEYGGIYTDMDNHPNTLFNATSIPADTDAYFLQEGGGFLSQYFFAVSPKHPLMFLAVQDVMREMHNLLDIGNFYVPQLSGPGATKRAFLHFMNLNVTNGDEVANKYSKPSTGHYVSSYYKNHSVTVFGHRGNNMEYVIRSAVAGQNKRQGWREMNITNYQNLNKQPNGVSCARFIHEHYYSSHNKHHLLGS